MLKVEKDIIIMASPESIWEKMLDLELYKEWTLAFSEGSFAKSDWQKGSPVVFGDASGNGLFGEVFLSDYGKQIGFRYKGLISGEERDTESDDAKLFMDTEEVYTFSPLPDGSTNLHIALDVDERYSDMMSTMWDDALLRVRNLCERHFMFDFAFEAPPESVYEAWTDANQLKKWFCPPGYDISLCEVKAEAGGYFRVHMIGPNGEVSPTRGDYLSLVAPNYILYEDSWDDDRTENTKLLTTLFIAPTENGSKLSVYTRFSSEEEKERILSSGIIDGWLSFMENLKQIL